jgi:hypothetical protein
MLSREVGLGRIQDHAALAARVVNHRPGDLGAGAAVDDQGPHGIGAEVDAE